MHQNELVLAKTTRRRTKCLACGTDLTKGGRRYCSKECRQQIDWVLSLSKGLLRTFNARYAVFFFTSDHVILDVLPIWAKGISRFISPRTNGEKPAVDLKNLILQSGREWHQMVDNRTSRSHASLFLLQRNHRGGIEPDSVKPGWKTRPRLSSHERDCLKILDIERDDLTSDECILKIKAAYKRLAKRYHPDMGGDEEKFKRLNEAHQKMLLWAENPQYTSRRALPDCWSYDGFTNRWAPPL